MATFLLIGNSAERPVITESATLDEARATIAAHRRDPDTLPRATENETDWIAEVAHQVEYCGHEAVHIDRDGDPWFYVLPIGVVPVAEPKRPGGDAESLWRAMAAGP